MPRQKQGQGMRIAACERRDEMTKYKRVITVVATGLLVFAVKDYCAYLFSPRALTRLRQFTHLVGASSTLS